MTKIKPLVWPAIIVLFLMGCRDDFQDTKYERPEWLAGKVYTQILEQPELSTFAKGVELIGYDTIIDVSGSYTVFAPSNDAFNAYFSGNPNYNSIESMPISELSRLIKYHIVQNPWSKLQLRSLDVFGWIDTLDIENNKPKGFKRETLLLDEDVKYGVAGIGNNIRNRRTIIIDTLETNWHRRAITDSRKFVPIFFQEYFNIYDLNSSDYEFYFNRPFEGSSEIYYANAKITSEEIFAENGFVYIIDEVVEPLKNAHQFISESNGSNDYTDFMDLLNLFPEFEYNERRTLEQPGAEEGLNVDSLFDLTYPELTFNINNEKTSAPTGTFGLPQNVTIRYHHGLMAPTNLAMADFEQEFFQIPNGWGSLDGAPINIKQIIAKTYMSINPIYKTDLEEGFYNGELDIIKLDESTIIQKDFGSNSTFIGLKEAIVPRAFSSVTGPVYLRRGYSKVMNAIEHSGLLPALKRPNKNYMFFVESDANTSLDSSLFYDSFNESFSVIARTGSGQFQEYAVNIDDLRTLLLNHIATDQPRGIARKEFIPNLAGNYIIINNETGEFSGTGQTTDGFRGIEIMPEFPTVISTDADNGLTYDVKNWFTFSGSSLFGKISAENPRFHSLLRKAGLSRDKEFRYSFISNSEFYTVFIPSDEALDSAKVNTLEVEELRKLLMLHFVQGELIFTDGKATPAYYETTRIDEESTQFSVVNTQIFIEPGIDVIKIHDKTGDVYVEVLESENSNQLTAISLGEGQEVFPVLLNNAVIHQIDKVLQVEELDTN